MKLKLAILPLCLIALNVFGFEGTVKQSVTNYNGTGTNVSMTWYLTNGGCRIDMVATGKDLKGGTTVLLINPATQTLSTYEVGGAEKVYFQVSASSISGDAPNVSVTKTAETKKIQGYTGEKWVVIGQGGTYDVWITKDIDFNAAQYKDFFKGSMEIQALAQQGVKGFPLLTESHTGANASTVEKVSAQAISASTLSVPADYQLYNPKQLAPAPKK